MGKNNFIDLTKILRTFEKGTKLYCSLHEDVFFEEVVDDLIAPIICRVGKGDDNFKLYLTKYGQLYNCNEAKRVILPVDGTWEKYMFRFNDGDLLYNIRFGFVICCKKIDILSKPEDYFTIDLKNKKVDVSHSRNYGTLEEYRRANEEEIKSVYDILRKNNKTWDRNKKELLSYRMPFCKDGDIVWCSKTNKNEEVVAVGYDCETEDFFYDLKVLKNLREHDLEVKRLPFKVGDIVTDGAYEYEIIRVGDLSYDTDVSFNINYCNLENYRLVEYENFNFKTLRPFDKVIVYTSFGWTCDFFSHANSDYSNFYCVTDVYDKIVPFNEETVSLLGTHDEIPLKYRFKQKSLLNKKSYSSFKMVKTDEAEVSEGILSKYAVAGDICLYNKITKKLLIVESSNFSASEYPSDKYSPVGVVVIPGNHNVYGDGSCAVMSLKEMSCDTPDTGSTNYQDIYCGQYGTDIISLINYNRVCYVGSNGTVNQTVQGMTDIAYLPSDKFNTVQNPYDKDTYFNFDDSDKYIPSPYNEDDTRNPAYYQTASPSSSNNAMSDFDGVGNTKILTDLATAQSDWKTASTITNNYVSGYSPAACCCWRYHTEGTKQGDWYMPAMGELGYMMVKFNKIQQTISTLTTAYGSTVVVQVNAKTYLSSSEYSSHYARILYTTSGNVGSYYDEDNTNYVRAFLRVKID